MLTIDISAFKRVSDNMNYVMKRSLEAISNHILQAAEDAFRFRRFDNMNWKATAISSKSTNTLAKSLRPYLSADTITVISELIYSGIQNDGGKIKVTDKMRRYFWSQYYSTKDNFWKNMVLTKKEYISIPARPYLKVTQSLISFAQSELNKNFTKLVEGGQRY